MLPEELQGTNSLLLCFQREVGKIGKVPEGMT